MQSTQKVCLNTIGEKPIAIKRLTILTSVIADIEVCGGHTPKILQLNRANSTQITAGIIIENIL